jgi:tartrate dehydratase alpha subunit/fumarate hydratase class I-like protein
MDTNNRPRGHERKVAGTGSVNKKGSGLGLGKPAGNTGGLSGRPGGLGGSTTAFAVNIETYATHIAGLPVGVNICCHVNRHAIREL